MCWLFYLKFGKRAADLGFAIAALVVLFPLMLGVAVVLGVSQNGAVFFKQTRVGRHGRNFSLYKFRSMAGSSGGFLDGTARQITPIGKLIRATKADEWPQFLNILKGDMSVVGPRPETPEWVEYSSSIWQKVLSVRPGMTDFASLKYIDEEKVLAESINPRELYKLSILPDKLALGVKYVDNCCFSVDCRIAIATVRRVLRLGTKESSFDA